MGPHDTTPGSDTPEDHDRQDGERDALLDRMTAEAVGFDQTVWDNFLTTHDGLTPHEWMEKNDPVLAEIVERRKARDRASTPPAAAPDEAK